MYPHLYSTPLMELYLTDLNLMHFTSVFSVGRFPVVRYVRIRSIQLGPISIESTSMATGVTTLSSARYSTLTPQKSGSEEDARRANWSVGVFSSLGTRVMENPFKFARGFPD